MKSEDLVPIAALGVGSILVASQLKDSSNDKLQGVAIGGLGFIGLSYIAHCYFGWGPWPCQKGECRHAGR